MVPIGAIYCEWSVRAAHWQLSRSYVLPTGAIYCEWSGLAVRMASECPSTQTRSRISGLDSASVCEAGIARELFSVSDLCRYTDEIQDLLDEITLIGDRDEMDRQGDGAIELQHAASRVTVCTWDSHQLQQPDDSEEDDDDTEYGADGQRRTGDVKSSSLSVSALDGSWSCRRLLSPLALAEVFLLLLCASCLVCVGISGDSPYVSPLSLPHVVYTRVAVVSSALCLLSTLLMLFIRSARIEYALLINWSLLHICLYCLLSAVHIVAASLLLHQLFLYRTHYGWITSWTLSCILATTVIGYCAAVWCLVIAWLPCVFPESAARPFSLTRRSLRGDKSAAHQQRRLTRADPTTATLVAPASGEDWNYQHPEPEPETASCAEAPPPPDSQHYLINNPYIQWHLQNGSYYLLPEAIRQQLIAPPT